MRPPKKIVVCLGAVFASAAGVFVACIGPWPVSHAGFEGTAYFSQDVAAVDRNAKRNRLTDSPGRLQAGWGTRLINPPPGVPMAGYGARQNIREYLFGDKPSGLSTGVHDDLKVKALALSDGCDRAVIVGADLLLIPPNVAAAVRQAVAQQTPLSASDILFGASHTHDGPGAWGRGLAAFFTGGTYNPQVSAALTEAFTQAIVEAYRSLGPARMAHGSVEAEQYIRNRARQAPIDTRLCYLVVEKEDGERCVLIRYSATS